VRRFSEDALRILRAVRFSSQLGFEIEGETERAVFSLSHLLKNISPERILTEFKKNKNSINRIILHTLFHCIFLHLFNTDFKKRDLWNLACDICVEKAINDCNLSCTTDKKTQKEEILIERLSARIKNFTAENIYFYLCNSNIPLQELSDYKQTFYVDCHSVWYENRIFNKIDEDEDVTQTEARSIFKIADDRDGDHQKNQKQIQDDSVKSRTESAEEDWKKITKRIIRDSEASASVFGISPGFDSLKLNSVVIDKCNYWDFLKKFIQTNEQLEINDDEFDYIYYMDSNNRRRLGQMFPKYDRFLPFLPRDVADPWYSGDFTQTWMDVEEGCRRILEELKG
jgi:tRNA nucleotidyltransferase/poly(A) polymerase